MLTFNGVSFTLPDGRRLIDNITFTLNDREKAALIGDNGVGKSTLLKIAAGEIPASGSVQSVDRPYYIPQFPTIDRVTIASAMRVEAKLTALQKVLNGEATVEDFSVAGDDWTLDDRIANALEHWGLGGVNLHSQLGELSGGQRSKVFLAGLMIHKPELIILDEPTNHLDFISRKILYDFIAAESASMLITSHDRTLLNLLDPVFELSRKGIARYGGNYEFYFSQRKTELDALHHDVQSKEKILRKAKEKERETIQRQQKLDSRGKGKQEKAGLPTILQHALKNSAERSTAKMKDVHAAKINNIADELQELKELLPDAGRMKLDIDHSNLHRGKVLYEADSINFRFTRNVWPEPLTFKITSGERIALKGNNGSGKTTLIRIMLGLLQPSTGTIKRSAARSLYIDQQYSLIDDQATITEQAQAFNTSNLEAHEVNIRLDRFLFPKDTWQKKCSALSGGERMRLTLCCLSIAHSSPDVIVLDEPTNNLDIRSIEILTSAINEYRGTLIVVSHDNHFLRSVDAQRTMLLHSNRPS